jgi:hypothetical protein
VQIPGVRSVRDLKRLKRSIVNVLQVKDLFYILLIERESRRFLLLRPFGETWDENESVSSPGFLRQPVPCGRCSPLLRPPPSLGSSLTSTRALSYLIPDRQHCTIERMRILLRATFSKT